MKTRFGMILFLIGSLTGCTMFGINNEEPEPILSFFVGPRRVSCVNPYRNNLCYQVKEKLDDPWVLYKGEVMGLQYEPGFIYELKVQADRKSQPSIDGPDVQWVLNQLISKSPVAQETEVPVDLFEKIWTLEQFGDPQNLTPAAGDTHPTLFFQLDGHFTGSSGCNRINGGFSTDGNRIQFDSLSATKNMCPTPAGLLDQEQTLLSTLEKAERYKLSNGQLQIYSTGDVGVLIFKQ